MSAPARRSAAPRSPLGELNAYIAQASQAARAPGAPAGGANSGPWPELRSAQRFRETWSRICAEEEVTQAVGRAPENAGPLNSHMLVLRTLGLMRDLSPDYLRRFLSQADTLLWLDQAHSKLRQPAAKARPAKAERQKK